MFFDEYFSSCGERGGATCVWAALLPPTVVILKGLGCGLFDWIVRYNFVMGYSNCDTRGRAYA